MKFGGMIGYYPGTIRLDFGIDWVKGQGHGKVNIFFLPKRGQFVSNWHATNAKMFIIQSPILWYVNQHNGVQSNTPHVYRKLQYFSFTRVDLF